MENLIRKKWFELDSSLRENFKIYGSCEKKRNEETTDKLIKEISSHLKKRPKLKKALLIWENEAEEIFMKFLKEDKILGLCRFQEDKNKDIANMTKEFIKKAKEFDEGISNNDLFQSLRNLWVIAILEMILGNEVKVNQGIFAYSMLYPYTDNFLDNVDVSVEAKKSFNKKLSSMIKGEEVCCESILEEKVYVLIKQIEEVFYRSDYSGVYENLLKIHEGQVKSIAQQNEKTLPYERDILGISIEKGGTSVLADGYLIRGELTNEEENFCFQYGALLQFIDDLQDVKDDKKNNHITVMSQLAGTYYLDPIINKLINYVYYVFDNAKLLKGKDDLRNIIKSNALVLIFSSVVLNREYFTQEYVEEIEKYLPFSTGYIEKLNKTLSKRIKKME